MSLFHLNLPLRIAHTGQSAELPRAASPSAGAAFVGIVGPTAPTHCHLVVPSTRGRRDCSELQLLPWDGSSVRSAWLPASPASLPPACRRPCTTVSSKKLGNRKLKYTPATTKAFAGSSKNNPRFRKSYHCLHRRSPECNRASCRFQHLQNVVVAIPR